MKYEVLKMFPTEREAERDANHAVEAANFKAKMFKELGASFFIESEKLEAANKGASRKTGYMSK